MKHHRIGETRSDRIFNAVNVTLVTVLTLISVYPLYFTVLASFSDPNAVALNQVTFWPVGFSLEAYKNIFTYAPIWNGYRNTILYTVGGTLLYLCFTVPAGFALSRNLPGKKWITWLFLVPMYISGGLIPTYLLKKSLGLINNPLVLIIGGAFGAYYAFIARMYFKSNVHEELFESAKIDGASDFRCFFAIALPLAKPIIAVMALFNAVGRWNAWFDALLYLNNADLYPLQFVLRMLIIENSDALNKLVNPETMSQAEVTYEMVTEAMAKVRMAQVMKYSIIFVASAPLLIAYPFLQKYFVKGVMIGSLKG